MVFQGGSINSTTKQSNKQKTDSKFSTDSLMTKFGLLLVFGVKQTQTGPRTSHCQLLGRIFEILRVTHLFGKQMCSFYSNFFVFRRNPVLFHVDNTGRCLELKL